MSIPERLGAAPVIETPRLLLRAHRPDDFDAYAALWADPAVTRFIGGQPLSRELSWSRLLRNAGYWPMLGFGFWAIEERASGNLIGELGFLELRRELTPSIEGTPEVGWALVPEAQGRGLASEALQAVLAWGDAHFQGADFACIINPDHVRSIAVAERFGFRETARTTYHGNASIIFRRPGAASNHLR
jgi:RimJ/RimL family protein N-acetyltransferase